MLVITEYGIPHENYTDPEFHFSGMTRDTVPYDEEENSDYYDYPEEGAVLELDLNDLPEYVVDQINQDQEEIAADHKDYYNTFEGRLDMWRSIVNVYGDPNLDDQILSCFHPQDEAELELLEYVQYEFRELDPEENTAVLRLLTRSLSDAEDYSEYVAKSKEKNKTGDTSVDMDVLSPIDFLWNLVDSYREGRLPKEWFVTIESN